MQNSAKLDPLDTKYLKKTMISASLSPVSVLLRCLQLFNGVYQRLERMSFWICHLLFSGYNNFQR